MKRKILTVICCAMLLSILSGCMLAKEDKGADANAFGDRLIGVLVTTEHLDLFDIESYIRDNLRGFQGGVTSPSGNEQQYQGRLYATLTARTLTSEETGETMEIEEYVFEGIEGIAFFAPTIVDTEAGTTYRSSMSDEGISNGHVGFFHGDDEQRVTMEGTIFVVPATYIVYYINPVYQSADGSVYVTTGSGISTSGVQSEGSVMSQTLSDTRTVTENGRASTDSASITIGISAMYAPETIVVLQMDKDSRVIDRVEYVPGTLPETVTLEAGTDYIIVETHRRNYEGNPTLSREVYGKDTGTIEAFFARDDGICVKQTTRINWTS